MRHNKNIELNEIKRNLLISKYNITDNLFSSVLEIRNNFCCQSAHNKLNYIFQRLSNRVCFQYGNTTYGDHYIFTYIKLIWEQALRVHRDHNNFVCIKLNWEQALRFQIEYIDRREKIVLIAQNISFFICVIVVVCLFLISSMR